MSDAPQQSAMHQFFTITGRDFRESIARSRRQSNSVRDQIQDRINRSGLRLQEQTGMVDSCMSIQRLHAAALEAELRGFDGLAGALRRLIHDWAARARRMAPIPRQSGLL